MGLPDFLSAGLDATIAAIRRQAISIAIAIAAGIGAVLYFASAAMLGLEALLGPILARVAVAVLLLIVAVAGYFAPRLLTRKPAIETPAADAEAPADGMTRDQRIAMIFEALLLGFSMGSRKPPESAGSRK